MGVPQKRERVFFIALRNDLCGQFNKVYNLFEEKPGLGMEFDEDEIPFSDVLYDGNDRPIKNGFKMKQYWDMRIASDTSFKDIMEREYNKTSHFNNCLIHKHKVAPTLTSNSDCMYLFDEFRRPNKTETVSMASFPEDYNFLSFPYHYICGMSVPPVMAAQVSHQVYEQWLKYIQ
jgi:DNA (cytosine-5)-methyltransferase 1